MTTDAPVVTLKGQPYTLVRPRPIEALALVSGGVEGVPTAQWAAVRAAALRMCWPKGVAWPARIPPQAFRLSQRVEEWGGIVYDNLVEAGVDDVEIVHAGAAAYNFATGAQVTQAEVTAAKGFSEPPAETPPAGG